MKCWNHWLKHCMQQNKRGCRAHSGKCGQYLISLGSSVRAIGQPVQPVQFTPHTQLHLLITMLLSSACLDSLSQGRGHCLLTAGDNVLVTYTVSFICTSMCHTFALKTQPTDKWNQQLMKHKRLENVSVCRLCISCVDCNHVEPLQFLATRSTCTYREARRL